MGYPGMRPFTSVALPLTTSLLLLAIYFRTGRQTNGPVQLRKKKQKSNKASLPSGLVNVGNSCYLSSVLQLLASANDLLIGHFRKCDSEIASTLSELLETINRGEQRKLRPIKFIKSFTGSAIGLSPEQQDAHEFLLALLNMKISKKSPDSLDLHGHPEPSKKSILNVSSPFTGVVMNELICLPCAGQRKPRHISSVRIEPFSCITIPPSSASKISEAVYKHFCTPERYSDYCNYRDGGKCGMGAVNQKHPLIFPALLFLHVALITSESFLKDDDQVIETELNLAGPGYRYKLISFIVHYGRTGMAGHFICYRRHGGGWIECNDENVRIISEEVVINERAYLLLYEKELL